MSDRGDHLLTALDVANQEFGREFRGYDRAQVDEFLDQVAETLHAFAERCKERDRTIEQLGAQAKEHQELRNSLQETLLMAQRSAEERIGAAEQQAGAIVAEAHARAERLVAEARGQVDAIRREVETLRQVRRQMTAELRGALSRFDSLLSAQETMGDDGR